MKSTWTDARKRSFIVSALRGARWAPKYECINKAFVGAGINPRTGRKCKFHRCSGCRQDFPKGQIQADHIEPVVGPEGFQGWDTYIERMFCGVEGFQALCKACHADKTLMERFRIDESKLKSLKLLIAFRKMKAAQQIKKLRQHKLPHDGNGKTREATYREYLEM
jgi:hypothetical protein